MPCLTPIWYTHTHTHTHTHNHAAHRFPTHLWAARLPTPWTRPRQSSLFPPGKCSATRGTALRQPEETQRPGTAPWKWCPQSPIPSPHQEPSLQLHHPYCSHWGYSLQGDLERERVHKEFNKKHKRIQKHTWKWTSSVASKTGKAKLKTLGYNGVTLLKAVLKHLQKNWDNARG